MLKHNRDISSVVKEGLCTGCGICQNICAVQAISVTLKKGINVPFINGSLCNNCGLCYKVCGGHSINLQAKAKELFDDESIKNDYYIGRYLSCHTGYSNNYNIRYHSASGGMLSQFLIFLLEKNIIQGAVIVRFDSEKITSPSVFIAKSKEEILRGRSSKYCPVSYDGIVKEIEKIEGKIVVVGLPCHIHSLRKYEGLNKRFKEKVLGYFALYCSGLKTMLSQDYIFEKYTIDKSQLTYFAYRDDGCLGFLKTIDSENQITKIPYKEYYLSLRGFFTPTRCTTCIDHYGELADVCFGDIHVDEYAKDTVGVNSIVLRNKFWKNYLQEAKNEGYITLDNVSADTVNSSQVYVKLHKKGAGVKTALAMRKLLGCKNPIYDSPIIGKISIKQVIRYFAHKMSRFIGGNPKLWFLIGWIDKFALFFKMGERKIEKV